MNKILLATDLAAKSDRALERALKLAKETGAKLYILHVLSPYKAKKFSASLKESTEDLIRGYLHDYKDSQGVSITVKAVEGAEPFAEILGCARSIKAGLIVMGMHGKAKIRDLFAGTTVERVVRRSVFPVLMVKNKPTGGPYQSILSAIDFAPGSRAALRAAMDIAPRAVCEAIHVYDVPVYVGETAYVYVESKAVMEAEQQKTLAAFINTEIARFKKDYGATPKLSGKLIQGPVYNALRKRIKTVKADIITLGAHGRIGLIPSKLGGVAHDILADPPCDVLVARARE